MRNRLLLSVILLVSLAADTPAPHYSTLLQAALRKRDASVQKASDVYSQSVSIADRELIKEADDAQRKAMRANNLDDANDALALKKKTQTELDAIATPTPSNTMTGRWMMRDSGGLVAHWIITATEVRRVGENGVFHLTQDGQSALVDWNNGWIDRLTLTSDQRLLKEDWSVSDGRKLPSGPPNGLGLGVRE